MSQSKKCTAIKALLMLASLSIAASAWSAPAVATVTNLSGPLLVRQADGKARILALQSQVAPGDTLITDKSGYARLRFGDDSEITLQPDTTFTVERFVYEAASAAADDAAFVLVRGGLQSTAGKLGKRSRDKSVLVTPGGTIGLQDATVIVQFGDAVAPSQASRQAYLMASTAMLATPSLSDAPRAGAIIPLRLAQLRTAPPAPTVGGLSPGLYVHVIDGLISLSNKGGSMNFNAGQFGFTPSLSRPPVIVPANPGMVFTPPPAFTASASPSGGGSGSKSNAVECEVR